ncbi:MAG TPA: FAD-dependent oxidoreductase, partial [Spirochaetales bacterium]|nr:FAD-dependent oxidoreductase [Spirochaetales bacterium]
MDFDVIVIGGGHAGIEAALASARIGCPTLLITQNLDCIGKMSCNPAIGGLSKGNLVREIDALGGEMGRLIDASLIQFRMLNKSRGPAVQSPRAQADRALYAALAKHTLEQQKGLTLFQDTVVDFLLDSTGNRIEGVVTERGRKFQS